MNSSSEASETKIILVLKNNRGFSRVKKQQNTLHKIYLSNPILKMRIKFVLWS